jgi:hypothetical protein
MCQFYDRSVKLVSAASPVRACDLVSGMRTLSLGLLARFALEAGFSLASRLLFCDRPGLRSPG